MLAVIIIVLILLNGYFSLAEIALVSVKESQLQEAAEKGSRKAQKALDLIREPEQFLSSVQVGITLLGIIEGIYGGDMVAQYLQPLLVKYLHMPRGAAHATSLITGIGLITYLTIVIGELIPKSVALQVPLRVSLAIAPSLTAFTKIAYPFVKVLTVSTQFILSKLSIRTQEKEAITEGEVRRMLSTAYKQGVLERSELLLHENIFTFNELTAKRIMKPARIVVTISSTQSREEAEAVIRQRPYSHFPVYTDTKDNITGIISTKNFFIHAEKNMQELVQPVCTLPPDMTAADIFLKFRSDKRDFGIVVNDKRKFLGVVAMQDIMEGVFGDIPELEDYTRYLYKDGDKEWVSEGFIHLQLIRRRLQLDWLREYEQEYVSVGEMLDGELQAEPRNGSRLQLNGVTFEVTEKDGWEIRKVRILLP